MMSLLNASSTQLVRKKLNPLLFTRTVKKIQPKHYILISIWVDFWKHTGEEILFWKKVVFKTYRYNVAEDLEQSKKKIIELSWEISFVRNVRFDKKLSFGLILLTYILFCFYSSDIVRRPQKSEKITHFVLTLVRPQNFQKKLEFFFKFSGLLTISELYQIVLIFTVSQHSR